MAVISIVHHRQCVFVYNRQFFSSRPSFKKNRQNCGKRTWTRLIVFVGVNIIASFELTNLITTLSLQLRIDI